MTDDKKLELFGKSHQLYVHRQIKNLKKRKGLIMLHLALGALDLCSVTKMG